MLNHKTANKSTAPVKKLGPEKNKQSSEAEEHTEEVRGRGRVLCFAQASLIPPH